MVSSKLASTTSKLVGFGANMLRASFGLGSPSEVKSKGKGKDIQPVSSDHLNMANDVLGLIYNEMVKAREEEKLAEELQKNHQEQYDIEEEKRHQEIIKAISLKRKPSKKKQPVEKPETKPEAKPEVKAKPKAETTTTTPKATPTTTTTTTTAVPKSTVVPTATKVIAGATIAGLLMPSTSVAQSIEKASQQTGVDKSLMYAMAKQESGFDAGAAAKTSSAKGLFQFIKGTWDGMVQKYGAKYPILKEKGPNDPDANALAGALYIKENSDYLTKNNIPVNATNIYAAHFLGAGGAKTLLTAEPTAQADKILPQAASANKPIFYEKDGTPRTVQQVINVLFEKVGRSQERYKAALDSGIVDSGTTVAAISKENKDLKDATQTKQVASVINNTVISKSGESKMAETQEPVKDRPAYEIKARA